MEWHLYAANFLLAAGWTMKQNGHVRIDFLSHRFGPKTQALIDILGTIVFCIPFCLIVIWAGSRFFHNAWSIKEMSDAPGGLPARYILKGFIPLGFSLIILQSLAELVRNVRTLAGKGEAPS
jgi:TRAP-type mannitol/chloroaromatic compound transport system permease small subunit